MNKHILRAWAAAATAGAVDAATGAQRWESFYDPGAHPAAVAVSPDGGTVFVTGDHTVAYDAATGAQRWAVPSPGKSLDMVAAPGGGQVFVTGFGGTVAYDAASGAPLWAHPGDARSIAVSPDGSTVVATGYRTAMNGFRTRAYDAA